MGPENKSTSSIQQSWLGRIRKSRRKGRRNREKEADRNRLASGCASMSSQRKCDLPWGKRDNQLAWLLLICHRHLCFGATVVSNTIANINAGHCPTLTCRQTYWNLQLLLHCKWQIRGFFLQEACSGNKCMFAFAGSPFWQKLFLKDTNNLSPGDTTGIRRRK